MVSRLCLSINLFICTLSYSQVDATIRRRQFNLDRETALQGYDAVSYFNKKPLKGDKSLIYKNLGVDYYFANSANLNLFKSNPDKYEPAFGGWCAYAMGDNGTKVEVDPETFKIINGKLYLFYNFYFNNTLKKWNINELELKSKAEKNWNNLIIK